MTTLERIAAALERLADAEEQAVLAKIPALPPFPPAGPVGPEPPAPVSQEFIRSRDLPPEPFLPFKAWQCPEHGGSKVVPAGVSKKTGRPYQAFVVCDEQGCDRKPPR